MAAGPVRSFSFEEAEVESGQYGCPMLSRARQIYAPYTELPSHRCNFGWAIHGDADIERCMAVESAVECWKAAQERVNIMPGPGPRQSKVEVSAD